MQGGDSELCPHCWELAGIENAISDTHDKMAEVRFYRAQIQYHLDAIKAQGGTLDAWADLLTYVEAFDMLAPLQPKE